MKRILTFFIVMAFLNCAHGQMPPPPSRSVAFDTVAEGLVLIAMTHPSIAADSDLADFYRWTYKKSRTMWLNNIIVQGNLNEFTIKEGLGPSSSGTLAQSTQYPRYNFGIAVPFGLFINNDKQIKADYSKYLSLSQQVEIDKRAIREQVLLAYNDYVMNKQLMDLQQDLTHDIQIVYLKGQKKFTNGDITLEEFTNISNQYSDQMTRQITLNGAYKAAEAKLENLIGMNVEYAIHWIKTHHYYR